jgi:hypothetical protein
LIAGSVALFSCTEDSRAIDPFPIAADIGTGAAVIRASVDDEPPIAAVVDTMSALTMFTPAVDSDPAGRRRAEVGLWSTEAGIATVKRAVFPDSTVFDLTPCADPPCILGEEAQSTEVQGVVGADLLSRGALRFRAGQGTLEFLPDLAGSDDRWRQDCVAVFKNAYAGGGNLVVGGDEVSYSARHAAVRTCLEPTPGVITERTGSDALFLISTALGTSLLSEAAYSRLQTQVGGVDLQSLPAASIATLAGTLTGRRVTLSTVSLVGEDARELGGCGELFASRLMTMDDCNLEGVVDCPCKDNETTCRTGAVVELEHPIDFIIVADTEPLLQSLRAELRPNLPEVDGILGTGALKQLRLDFDYPNSRMLARCVGPNCQVRPPVNLDSTTPFCPGDGGNIEIDGGL